MAYHSTYVMYIRVRKPKNPSYLINVSPLVFFLDLSSLRHRWAENRWQRAFTLINNHSLVVAQLSKQALENLRVEEPLKKEEAKDSIE